MMRRGMSSTGLLRRRLSLVDRRRSGPVPWDQLRAGWRARAEAALSGTEFEGADGVDRMLARVVGSTVTAEGMTLAPARMWLPLDGRPWRLPRLRRVARERSTWTRWHVRAEVSRLTRSTSMPPDEREAMVDAVTGLALKRECLRLDPAEANPAPPALQRRDGESVYEVHGAARFTSEKLILAVEERLVAAADERTAVGTAEPVFAAAQAMVESERQLVFDADQVDLARAVVCDDRRLVARVGAAGAGKTTAMRLAAAALALDGRRLVAVAPSARAAAVLSQEIDAPGVTVAKLLHSYDAIATRPVPEELWLRSGDVLLVDEAGMTGTPALGRLLDVVEQAGAVLRLVGDPMQLSAVEAGGALRLLASMRPATMSQVHRFADPREAAASLGLRAGKAAALAFYVSRDRVTEGSRLAMAEDVYQAWREDADNGLATVMISSSTVEVAHLSARARADQVAAGRVTSTGIALHDGNVAGVGDLIVTRVNQRLLTVNGGRDFVKNGDLWRVRERLPDSGLLVEHLDHHAVARLPGDYVRRHVELGYATTVHRAQGMTVDTAHVLVDRSTTREALYVAMTRGRLRNNAYLVTDEALDVDLHIPPDPSRDGLDLLRSVLARDSAERSATETARDLVDASESLSTLVPRYLDGLSRALTSLGVEEQVRSGLRDVGGEALEATVTSSPSWARLVLACAVADPRALVREAVRSRLVGDANEIRDLAALLTWRIERLDDPLAQPTPSEDGQGSRTGLRPPWLPSPPAALIADPIGRWAIRQDALVRERVQALVLEMAEHPPAWAARLCRMPAEPAERAQWERDVAAVVAYRDQSRLPAELPIWVAAAEDQGDAAKTASAAWHRLVRSGQQRPEPPIGGAVDGDSGDVRAETPGVKVRGRERGPQPMGTDRSGPGAILS